MGTETSNRIPFERLVQGERDISATQRGVRGYGARAAFPKESAADQLLDERHSEVHREADHAACKAMLAESAARRWF